MPTPLQGSDQRQRALDGPRRRSCPVRWCPVPTGSRQVAVPNTYRSFRHRGRRAPRRSAGGRPPPGPRGTWRRSAAARRDCVRPTRRPGSRAPRRSATSTLRRAGGRRAGRRAVTRPRRPSAPARGPCATPGSTCSPPAAAAHPAEQPAIGCGAVLGQVRVQERGQGRGAGHDSGLALGPVLELTPLSATSAVGPRCAGLRGRRLQQQLAPALCRQREVRLAQRRRLAGPQRRVVHRPEERHQ